MCMSTTTTTAIRILERPRRAHQTGHPVELLDYYLSLPHPPLLCETLSSFLLYVAPNKATRIDNGAVGTRKTECAKLANNM